MSGLKLAPALTLPPEAALQRFGILAMSGAGKSNAAVVFAEEMYDCGIPWVAIDPKGDWWGVRSSKSGKGDGLKVPVFGGLKGDVPLEETAGKLIAALVASKRLTCVLDISEMSKGAQLRFLTDFADTLLRENRAPLQVICEEADEYLPQRVMKREAPCVGAWSKLVKRGRFRGVFVTLVTQRSAALNKDALSQIDTLIPMRVGDPRDKKALREWVVEHDVGQEMFDSLPRLEDGEAWLWSPHKLKLMERVRFRRRRTFDSGATPDWEEREPARLADIDLDAVRDEMAEAIEKATLDDPKALRKRIAKLERELKMRPTETETVEVEKIVEVPVLANGAADELKAAVEAIREVGERLPEAVAPITAELERVQVARASSQTHAPTRPGIPPVSRERVPQARAAPPANTAGIPELISQQARKMLQALTARHPMRLTRSQWSAISGYSSRSSSWSTSIRELRDAGLIHEDHGEVQATQTAFDLLGEDVPEPQTSEEIIATWRRALKGPQAVAFFDTIVGAHPEGISRDELAEQTGYSKGSSSFSSTITALRRNRLIEDHGGELVASDDLFLGESEAADG